MGHTSKHLNHMFPIFLMGGTKTMIDPKDYDRIHENESDGQKFYGYDHDDGKTSWIGEDGILDSVTDTPSDEDDEW